MAQKTVTKTFFAFGTANTISTDSEAKESLAGILGRMRQLHAAFSVYENGSEISAINQNAGRKYTEISADTEEVLRKAIRCAALTDGRFDITAWPLIRLWKHAEQLPEKKQIRRLLRKRDARDILLKKGTVLLRQKEMGIDLGGIAKGYAADVAAALLRKQGTRDFLINFGGTVVVGGRARRIGIQDPFSETGAIIGSLTLRDQAIVTSGSYERPLRFGDKTFSHILDPRTGCPTDSTLISATLIGRNACELDAMATGVLAAGPQEGCRILARAETEGILIEKNGDLFTTSGLKERFNLRRTQQ